jgi:DNA-directed RNA polymerase subunit RPC12/RpoP
MTLRKAIARERKNGTWYIICPECRSRIDLDECPAPGGMNFNVEFCYECGTEIEVYPSPSTQEARCRNY